MIRKIEELSMNAQPSLQTMLYDGWVLRFAGGYTRRANSINPLYPSRLKLAEKISRCEDIYQSRNLPVVFKMTKAAFPSNLEDTLIDRGYQFDAETSVQTVKIRSSRSKPDPQVLITDIPSEEWLGGYFWLTNTPTDRHSIIQNMLKLINPSTGYATMMIDGEVTACGLAVCQGNQVGFFDIVTAGDHRRKGYGERIMHSLLQWAFRQGAKMGYLQVMCNNPPALSLYAKLGFVEKYRYWYRVKKLG